MADIYCPNCFSLTNDRATHCPSCGRRGPGSPARVAAGRLVLSGFVGVLVTGIYARVLYLSWPRWVKVFGTEDPMAGHYAEEAAVLFGVAVFVFIALLTMSATRTGTND